MDNMDWYHTQPRKNASIMGSELDLDAPVNWPDTPWALACLIGMCRSDILNGYPDAFDAVDQRGYAEDITRFDEQKIAPMKDWTLGDLLRDYAKQDDDVPLANALRDLQIAG